MVCACAVAASAGAATAELLREDVEVSYIYAAVLGTGTYTLDGRRVTMLRLPFGWTERQPTASRGGVSWSLPVVLGYDDLTQVDSDWIDSLLPDNLLTLTVLPGVEYARRLGPGWTVKPYLHLGGGRDFSEEETIVMTKLGVRSLWETRLGPRWTFRWGNALGWAGEYQVHSNDHSGFGIFETGLDLRRALDFEFAARRVDVGTYYVYQRFMPRWSTSRAPDRSEAAVELHELGLSLGFNRPFRILGIPFQRLRAGYKKGGGFEGLTLGTEFPF